MIDCGRFPAKRVAGDAVEVSADIWRDGHEILRADIRCRRRRTRGPGRAPPMRRVDAHARRRPLGRATFPVDGDRPLAVHDRGVDRRLRHLARRAGAQGRRPGRRTCSPSCSRASRCSRTRSARDRGPAPTSALIEHALEQLQHDDRRRRTRSTPVALDAAARRRRRAPPRPRRRRAARRAARADRRPRARALRRLVRAVPALVRRLQGRRGAAPAPDGARLRRHLPAADPPDRPHEPQGPQQRARSPGPDDPGSPVGDRRRDRRPRRGPPRARHARRLRPPDAGGARARHGHRARLRDPVLAPTTRG